ncbi:MAG: response regulator [Calditrichaeota bacterium]|nr:MAG: response regulator [Calditrichota bacterium]
MHTPESKEKTSYSILIIDDEETVRKVCKFVLIKAGHVVHSAESGFQGLEILRSNSKIDIVITDLKMPNMDGQTVLREVKRDWPHIEVLMMTGYATIEYAIEAMKAGAADFILKPLSTDQIRVAINKCIDKINLNHEIEELRHTNKKLMELKDIKEKFLAITSHELRTPIGHIKGYFNILNDDFINEMSQEEIAECKNIINNAIFDLEELVNSMFDVVRFRQKEIELNIEDVKPAELLQQIKSAFRLALEERHLSLEIDNYSNGLVLTADRLKLKAMLTELIKNAIKFTNDEGQITVQITTVDNQCHIIVKDTGIGIPHSEQGKIFEPFYEVQHSDYHSSGETSFKGGGLGIGLTQVKEIVKAHGGEIKVESSVGEGSVFAVAIPIEFKGDAM